MKTALMVAEKPSLALNLANILSNGKCTTNKSKYSLNFKNDVIIVSYILFNITYIFDFSSKSIVFGARMDWYV